jgi:mRNA interferase RelE/StbE
LTQPPEQTYQVSIPRRISKRIERFSPGDFERVTGTILVLGTQPKPPGRKKTQGRRNEWGVRVDNYRIVYEVDDDAQTVTITAVGHRRDVYRRG